MHPRSLAVGLTLAGHGVQKLFGWFGGPGLIRLKQGFEKQGFKPVWLWITLAIVGEVGGGLSVALGFLTPLGAAGIVGAMAIATFKSHNGNRQRLVASHRDTDTYGQTHAHHAR